MTKAGRTGDTTRSRRNNNVPKDDDAQTELEAELAASGRHDAFPREGLVGATSERRETLEEGREDEGEEPTGPGADVAPTKRAEARERERHRIERELGHTPAGEEGQIHGRNAPGVSREALDQAAQQADRRVVGHDLPKRRG
jgi:hypothetical protein